jgi:hypothetical protein
MNIRPGRYLALLVTGSLVTGCYEKPQVTFFEPGEYQGRTDPLLALEASPEQQEKLLKRLELVQMDR